MPTIRVITPPSTPAIDPNDLIWDLHDEEPLKRNLPELLLKLGQKVLENDLPSEWMSMSQVSSLCRRYRLDWKHRCIKLKHLEPAIRDYFDNASDIKGCGIKVEAKYQWNERKRRQTVYLRFNRLNPDGTCS